MLGAFFLALQVGVFAQYYRGNTYIFIIKNMHVGKQQYPFSYSGIKAHFENLADDETKKNVYDKLAVIMNEFTQKQTNATTTSIVLGSVGAAAAITGIILTAIDIDEKEQDYKAQTAAFGLYNPTLPVHKSINIAFPLIGGGGLLLGVLGATLPQVSAYPTTESLYRYVNKYNILCPDDPILID